MKLPQPSLLRTFVRPLDRALAYLRRSTTDQKDSFDNQFIWTRKIACQLKLRFDAKDNYLDLLTDRSGRFNAGDVYADDGISGADINRPGWNAMLERAFEDPTISHLLFYSFDRNQRPRCSSHAVALDRSILSRGITIVASESIIVPGGHETQEDIISLIEYDRSGKFRVTLSRNVVDGLIRNAQRGGWNGGPVPFGFYRVLCNAQGNVVRVLPKKGRFTEPSCHVELRPDFETLPIRLYILELGMLGHGATSICNILDRQTILPPGGGRGWNRKTINRILRSKLNVGILEYAKTSVGEIYRATSAGPRLLTADDVVNPGTDRERLKIVCNAPDQVIRADAHFDPLCDPEKHDKLLATMNARSQSQAGVPRVTNLARYPLSTLVIDNQCGHIMYGKMKGLRKDPKKSYPHTVYTCSVANRGLARQRTCNYNTTNAEQLLDFVVSLLKQLVGRAGGRAAFESVLRERMKCEIDRPQTRMINESQLLTLRKSISDLETDKAQALINLARERDESIYAGLKKRIKEIEAEIDEIRLRLTALERESKTIFKPKSIEERVTAVLAKYDEFAQLLNVLSPNSDPEQSKVAREQLNRFLRELGFELRLHFVEASKGKRRVHPLRGGKLSLGTPRRPGIAYIHEEQSDSIESAGSSDPVSNSGKKLMLTSNPELSSPKGDNGRGPG